MRDPEFKPCPFCGGDDIRSDRHPRVGRGEHAGEDVWTMCCYACGASFPGRYRKELLVEAWNRRHDPGQEAADAGRLARIADIIDRVDARCALAEGPVTPTLLEMTQEEISTIYALALRRPEGWRPG